VLPVDERLCTLTAIRESFLDRRDGADAVLVAERPSIVKQTA